MSYNSENIISLNIELGGSGGLFASNKIRESYMKYYKTNKILNITDVKKEKDYETIIECNSIDQILKYISDYKPESECFKMDNHCFFVRKSGGNYNTYVESFQDRNFKDDKEFLKSLFQKIQINKEFQISDFKSNSAGTAVLLETLDEFNESNNSSRNTEKRDNKTDTITITNPVLSINKVYSYILNALVGTQFLTRKVITDSSHRKRDRIKHIIHKIAYQDKIDINLKRSKGSRRFIGGIFDYFAHDGDFNKAKKIINEAREAWKYEKKALQQNSINYKFADKIKEKLGIRLYGHPYPVTLYRIISRSLVEKGFITEEELRKNNIKEKIGNFIETKDIVCYKNSSIWEKFTSELKLFPTEKILSNIICQKQSGEANRKEMEKIENDIKKNYEINIEFGFSKFINFLFDKKQHIEEKGTNLLSICQENRIVKYYINENKESCKKIIDGFFVKKDYSLINKLNHLNYLYNSGIKKDLIKIINKLSTEDRQNLFENPDLVTKNYYDQNQETSHENRTKFFNDLNSGESFTKSLRNLNYRSYQELSNFSKFFQKIKGFVSSTSSYNIQDEVNNEVVINIPKETIKGSNDSTMLSDTINANISGGYNSSNKTTDDLNSKTSSLPSRKINTPTTKEKNFVVEQSKSKEF